MSPKVYVLAQEIWSILLGKTSSKYNNIYVRFTLCDSYDRRSAAISIGKMLGNMVQRKHVLLSVDCRICFNKVGHAHIWRSNSNIMLISVFMNEYEWNFTTATGPKYRFLLRTQSDDIVIFWREIQSVVYLLAKMTGVCL